METPEAKPSRWKRLFRRALFALAALVTLVALFVAEEDWRGARAWQNYQRDMEAKGEHFDAARLIPPKVPDDQNFAVTPYFAAYFNLPPEVLRQPIKLTTRMVDGVVVTNADSLALHGTNITPQWFNREVKRAPRPLGWNHGVAADLIGWADVIQDTNASPPPVGMTNPVQAASIILDNMKTCEPTLAELQAASQRPFSRFNLNYEEIANPQVISALLQFLGATKGLYRVLALHAEAQMVLGRTDQALNDINVLFRIDDGLKDEPTLISQLVRFAGVAILLQPVGEGLAEHRWSEGQLRVLQERLQKTDLIGSTVLAFYGERDLFFPNAVRQEVYSRAMPRGWNRLEQINLNRELQETMLPRIDVAAREIKPNVNQACDLEVDKLSAESRLRTVFEHAIFAAMTLPASSKVPQKTAIQQSQVDMAMVACALERYRLAEGHYPEALNELVPRFAATLPHDIINGQPLKYRRTDDGRFILYSVGWNEKDDGGVVAPTKGNPPRQDYLQGDWVWEYPAAN
jgi:hypothetical protein